MQRYKRVKVFASKATQDMPTKFGTNISVLGLAEDVANTKFIKGVEALHGELTEKDLNSILFYYGSLIRYLSVKGIGEYSPYEDYPIGSVVTYNNEIYLSTREVTASMKEVVADPCNRCQPCVQCEEIGNPVYPSTETGWCKLVTHCQYDSDKKLTEQSIEALSNSIQSLKGVTDFHLEKSKGSIKLFLSDGSIKEILLDDFILSKYVSKESMGTGLKLNETTGKWIVEPDGFVDRTKGLDILNGQVGISEDVLNNINTLKAQLTKVTQALDKTKQDLEKESKDLADKLKNDLGTLGQSLQGKVDEAKNEVKSGADTALQNAKTELDKALKELKQTLEKAKQEASQAVQNLQISTQGNLSSVAIDATSGLSGNGTITNPLKLSPKLSTLITRIEELESLKEKIETVDTLSTQVSTLESKLTALEEKLNKPCQLKILNTTSVTVENTHNVIVSSGGTITFPNSLKVGRSFLVIREGDGEVILEGVTNTEKKLDKPNSAVTVLVLSTGHTTAFGSLKA